MFLLIASFLFTIMWFLTFILGVGTATLGMLSVFKIIEKGFIIVNSVLDILIVLFFLIFGFFVFDYCKKLLLKDWNKLL